VYTKAVEFDWDEANLEKLARRHRVEPYEAEEVLLDPRRIGVGVYNSPSERRYGVIGETEDGRILVVVFTKRGDKVRVLMARDAESKEKRRYRRK
jgi:uncharacterized protein